MSYGYDAAMPVAYSQPSERANFIRTTYLHLAGAILAFAAIECAIFMAFGVENVMMASMRFLSTPMSNFIVIALFIGAGFLARMWARSRGSIAMQYAGLGLYVVAEALIFIPLLAVAQYFTHFEGIIPQAGVLTLMLFGGLTTAAFVTRKDFSFLAPIISVASWLILGVVIISMFFPASLQLGMWFSFLVIALAAASILYTTSNILLHYSTDMYVAAALELFAAVATLFYYIIVLLMQSRGR